MLLLLISLFSNFDLFYCNQVEQANFNKTQLSAQMHRSIRVIDTVLREFQKQIIKKKSLLKTFDLEDNLKDGLFSPMWWEETPGIDRIGRNNPAITFLPPVGHVLTNTSEDKDPLHTKNLWENLNLLQEVQLNSPSIPEHPPNHPDYPLLQPPFTFLTFPPLTKLPHLDPHYLTFYSTHTTSISFTRPAYSFSVPPRTAPSPVPARDREAYLVGSPSTWIDPLKPIRPTPPSNDTDRPTTTVAVTKSSQTITRVSTSFPSPPFSIPVMKGPVTSNPKTSTIFTTWKPMKERTDYTPIKGITNANRTKPMIHLPRQIGRTLSKAQAWVLNRQWTKTTKAGRTNKSKPKQRLRVPDLLPVKPPASSSLPAAGNEALAATAFTGSLHQEDADGFFYVTIPTAISTTLTYPSAAAGDVLHFARNYRRRPSGSAAGSPNQVYHNLMDELDEGYIVVFLLMITRLVSLKNHSEVRDVLYHSELIMNGFDHSDELRWAGDRIMDMATTIIRFCSQESTHNIKTLRRFAAMLNRMLRERVTALSAEVNSIIDYADLMYEDGEGEDLFDALREFEEYPNATKTSREVCSNLMMTFLKPFLRLRTAPRCQRLLDLVNRALIQRFGDTKVNDELPMLGGTATTTPSHSIETKRIHNSLKRRISVKRHLINRTKHNDSNEDQYRRQLNQAAEYPMSKSNLPIPSQQKRFRVTTPRQLRLNAYLNIERPTNNYFYRRLGRPIHPPNGMLKFFP